jgi:cytochrome c oxidase subunit 2
MKMTRTLLLAGLLALAGGAAAATLAARQPRTIHVVARRFTFSPSEIHLKRGEPVVLEFTTEDVLMGFNAPDLHARTDIPPGTTMRVSLTPDSAGRFPFLCDVFCGSGHENMNGMILVVD